MMVGNFLKERIASSRRRSW